MSTLPASSEAGSFEATGSLRLRASQAAGLAALLSILGVVTIWAVAADLWSLWMTDALRSVGMFVPVISLVLILRAWRSLGWEMDGSWWGLAILAVTAAVVYVRQEAVMLFVFSPQWAIYLPPHRLVAFAYGSGVVLLFGGRRLFRASLFPLGLLCFVNATPHSFNVLVDLPLQRASSHVARAFAMALGQPLTPDHLRLMFTPKFGMFIAPGCNGIRGSVTMGLIALIAGYVYRFRWYAQVAVVAGAVLLGYVFNLARLCTLVLYYLVALHFPWLQNKAEMGDYVIGACLFLFGTMLLLEIIQRLKQSPSQVNPPATDPASLSFQAEEVPSSFYPRFAGMLVLVLFSGYGVARAYARTHSSSYVAGVKSDQNAPGQFPEHIGSFSLERTWNENLFAGPLIFHWADYAPADGGPHVALGISPVLGSHDTLICHSARGEDPLWRDQLVLPTMKDSISFSGSFFNNGVTQSLEATTICNGTSCGEYSSDRPHFGFVYSKPTAQALFDQNPARPIPILLKVETIDTTLPAEVARREMIASLRSFLGATDLNSLTMPYRRP
jgi:exosortase J